MKKKNKHYLHLFNFIFFNFIFWIPEIFCKESINFLSLKKNEVILRQGPSFEYPIKLIYKKKYLTRNNFRYIGTLEKN